MYCPSTYRGLCCRLTGEGVQSSRQTTRRHENKDGSRECSRRHLPTYMYVPTSQSTSPVIYQSRQTDSINLPPTITSMDNTHHTSTNAESPKPVDSPVAIAMHTRPKKKKKKNERKKARVDRVYDPPNPRNHPSLPASSDTLKEKKKERKKEREREKKKSEKPTVKDRQVLSPVDYTTSIAWQLESPFRASDTRGWREARTRTVPIRYSKSMVKDSNVITHDHMHAGMKQNTKEKSTRGRESKILPFRAALAS